jgi:hypothetical protein
MPWPGSWRGGSGVSSSALADLFSDTFIVGIQAEGGAAAANVGWYNQPAGAITGTMAPGPASDDIYCSIATGAVINTEAEIRSTNAVINGNTTLPLDARFIIKSISTAVMRLWVGLITPAAAGFGNLDNQGVSMYGFRYSTAAGDASFVPVVNNGAAQTLGTPIGGMDGLRHELRIQADGPLGGVHTSVTFSIDGGGTQVLSPALAAANFQIAASIWTLEAVAKSFLFSRLFVYQQRP